MSIIKVKTLTGKEIDVPAENDNTIEQLKERIEERTGVPPKQQRLIFGGRQLADNKTLKEFEIGAGSVLHLVLALRGGQS